MNLITTNLESIFQALRDGHRERVVAQFKDEPTLFSEQGVLHGFAYFGDKELVELTLSSGVDPNVRFALTYEEAAKNRYQLLSAKSRMLLAFES